MSLENEARAVEERIQHQRLVLADRPAIQELSTEPPSQHQKTSERAARAAGLQNRACERTICRDDNWQRTTAAVHE